MVIDAPTTTATGTATCAASPAVAANTPAASGASSLFASRVDVVVGAVTPDGDVLVRVDDVVLADIDVTDLL